MNSKNKEIFRKYYNNMNINNTQIARIPKEPFTTLDQIDLEQLQHQTVQEILQKKLSFYQLQLMTKEQKKNLVYFKYMKAPSQFVGCPHTTSLLGFHCKNCDKIYTCSQCHDNCGFDDLEIDYFICLNCNEKLLMDNSQVENQQFTTLEYHKNHMPYQCQHCNTVLYKSYCEQCNQFSLDETKHCEKQHRCTDEQCQVCFESLSLESMLLTCGHYQHINCYYSQRNTKCQTCQSPQERFYDQQNLIAFVRQQFEQKYDEMITIKCKNCDKVEKVYKNKKNEYVCLECGQPQEWPIINKNITENILDISQQTIQNIIDQHFKINTNIIKLLGQYISEIELFTALVLSKNITQQMRAMLNSGLNNIVIYQELLKLQYNIKIFVIYTNDLIKQIQFQQNIYYFNDKIISLQMQDLFKNLPQDFVFENEGYYVIGTLKNITLDMNNLNLEQSVELITQNYNKDTQKENPYITVFRQVKDLYPFADKSQQYKTGQRFLGMWQNSNKTQTSTFYPCTLVKDYNPNKYTMILVEFDPTKKGKQLESMQQINDIQCVAIFKKLGEQ